MTHSLTVLGVFFFVVAVVAQPTGLPTGPMPTVWPMERLPYSECSPVSQLTALTFRPGDVAYRRRNPSVPSMVCIDCPAGTRPPTVQCVAHGLNDFGRPQWVCEAQDGMNLGTVEVVCEGCSGPGDTLVLKGSCQLQYQNTQNTVAVSSTTTIIAVVFFIFLACCVKSGGSTNSRPHIVVYDNHQPTYGATTGTYYGGGGGHGGGGKSSFGGTSVI